jgi:serine/threonine protein kinase
MDEARAARMTEELKGKSVQGWLIDKFLGNGKSALVFRAVRGDVEAAIKIFDPELIERFGAAIQDERISRELSLIGKSHPNLVDILGGGHDFVGESRHYFVAMEFLPWKNLQQAIPSLPPSAIYPILRQIAEAARFLEKLGLCHRDIKPENIAVNDTLTEAKLLDFGVIRPLSPEKADPTGASFVGSLRYAPPEFLLRQEKDDTQGWRAVTFYQLGAVLHDMIVRKPLFERFSEPYAVLSNAVQQEICDDFPEEPALLVSLSKNCLLKNPEARLKAVAWADFVGDSEEDRVEKIKRLIAQKRTERIGESLQINKAHFDERWKASQIESIVEAIRQEIQSDSDTFPRFEVIILTRSRKLSDEEMLEKLRGVLTQHGRISGILIDEAEDLPSSSAFRNRFGSLISAYRLIGYDPEIDYSFIEINRQIRKKHPEIIAEVLEKLHQMGSSVSIDEKTDLIFVNGEWTVSIVLCRYQRNEAGTARWIIRLDEGLKPDITIAVRLDETNTGIRDYYLLPALDMSWGKLRIAEENGVYLDAYQFEALDYFYGMAERCRVEEAA